MKPEEYYDVTSLVEREMKKGKISGYSCYIGVYVYEEGLSFWVVRIQEDINGDYKREEGKFLLERNEIDKDDVVDYILKKQGTNSETEGINDIYETDEFLESLPLEELMVSILEVDHDEKGLENWDYEEYDSLVECLETIDIHEVIEA